MCDVETLDQPLHVDVASDPVRIPRLLYLESVDANSVAGDTPEEHLYASQAIAEERGFASLAVTRGDDGQVITPDGFTDDAFDLSTRSQTAVAARTIEASRWGMAVGADYVAQHWPMTFEPEIFSRMERPRWPMLYAGTRGDTLGREAKPRPVYGSVGDVRLSPDGDTIVWIEWLRGADGRDVNLVWTEDAGGASRRLAARLESQYAPFGDMSISPDGRWLLAGQPTELVDLQTGHAAFLGAEVWAACWHPAAGASCLLAAAISDFNSPAELFVLDLAAWRKEVVGAAPRRTIGLQIAPDGTIAARVNAESEAQQGGWFDELQITSDYFRTWEPVAPLVAASGWRRRCTRPRWTDPWPEEFVRPVILAPVFEDHFRSRQPILVPQTGEDEFVVENVRRRIRHRVARLAEDSSMATPLMADLRALTEHSIPLDGSLAATVRESVVPLLTALARANSWPDHLHADVAEIAALAEERRSRRSTRER
jgi:hypothetical protein